jgi:putative oxidoreductase
MFPQLAAFIDLSLLLLRFMVGAIFLSSGWSHLTHPVERGQSIGMSKGFTIFLGAAEFAGALGVIFGVLTQLAAGGLVLVMLGAIQKKIFVWKSGFWGKHGSDGWHYDIMLVVMNLVIITTGGGKYVLWNSF